MAIPRFSAPSQVRAGEEFNINVSVRNKDLFGGPDTATLTVTANSTSGTTGRRASSLPAGGPIRSQATAAPAASVSLTVAVGSNQTQDVTLSMTIPEAGDYTLEASLSGGISGSNSTQITVNPREGEQPNGEQPNGGEQPSGGREVFGVPVEVAAAAGIVTVGTAALASQL